MKSHSRQSGAALFISLVALLAMTIVGLALIRSMDAAGLISGNFSFRQAALSVADFGLEGALLSLESSVIPGGRDVEFPAGCTHSTSSNSSNNCNYYPGFNASYNFNYDSATCTAANCDLANGVSQRINWANVPHVAINFAALGGGFDYQYVIERLCDNSAGVVPTANVRQLCYSMDLQAGGNSQESRSAQLGSVSASNEVAYRTTIRINGPHNTSTMVQTIFMKN